MARKEEDPRKFGIRKLSMMLFGSIAIVTIICGAAVGIHFNDPKWFEYAAGTVFGALLLVAFFGWPIED